MANTNSSHDARCRSWSCAALFLLSYAVLIPGLTAPLFTVDANIDMFGMKINVLNLTKSTLGTVEHLWSGGHVSPALLILFFSVILPFLKLAAVMYAAWVFWHGGGQAQLLRCVRAVSKWATVDAFCILTFAAFLSGDPRIAVTLHSGFYCFFAYCLLSVAAALAFPSEVDRHVHYSRFNVAPFLTFAAWVSCLFLPVISLNVSQLGINKSLSFLGMVEALDSAGLRHISWVVTALVVLLPLLEVVCGLAHLAQVTAVPQMNTLQHWAMLDVFAVSMLVTALAAKGMAGEIAVEVSQLGCGVVVLCIFSHVARFAADFRSTAGATDKHSAEIYNAKAATNGQAQRYGILEDP